MSSIVMSWVSDSAAVADPPPAPVVAAAVVPSVAIEAPAEPGPELGPVAEPVIVPGPLIVANPQAGDLRLDGLADVLPADYVAPDPATTILDIAYGDEPAQRLDLYLPDEANAPVVVFLHSGGWVAGDKAFVPPMVMRFVERGYAVASVGYRLAPEHTFPAPIHDVKLALRWLKAHGADSGSIDGDRIVLYGTSAGGHLASFVAATPRSYEPEVTDTRLAAFDSTVVGVVSAVGPVDLTTFYRHDNEWAEGFTEAFLGCAPCAVDQLEAASPISHLHPDLPPAYFAYGPEDGLVPADNQGEAIAAAWSEATDAGSVWLDLVDGRGHNLDGNSINQRALEAFIDSTVTAQATVDPA